MRFVQRTRDEMRRCYTRTYSRTIFILCFIGTCIVIMFEHITLTGHGSVRKLDSNTELNKCECPFSPDRNKIIFSTGAILEMGTYKLWCYKILLFGNETQLYWSCCLLCKSQFVFTWNINKRWPPVLSKLSEQPRKSRRLRYKFHFTRCMVRPFAWPTIKQMEAEIYRRNYWMERLARLLHDWQRNGLNCFEAVI